MRKPTWLKWPDDPVLRLTIIVWAAMLGTIAVMLILGYRVSFYWAKSSCT